MSKTKRIEAQNKSYKALSSQYKKGKTDGIKKAMSDAVNLYNVPEWIRGAVFKINDIK